jgi:flavin reductase (DIM6/NTAB) family NADH-FMN oxidoreductase RutF
MCSVCAEPPLLLACVMADNEFCALADASKQFTINILSQRHVHVAMTFAGLIEGDTAKRFDTGNWTSGTSGSPVLSDALVSLECKLDSAMTRGTHRIYIGEVIAVHTSDGQPLIYTARGFANAAPLID